jgi:hypothetical protein
MTKISNWSFKIQPNFVGDEILILYGQINGKWELTEEIIEYNKDTKIARTKHRFYLLREKKDAIL